MISVDLGLIDKAMTAGTSIMSLELDKLFIFLIGKHLVENDKHNISKILVVLIKSTTLRKRAQHSQLLVITSKQKRKKQKTSFCLFTPIFDLATQRRFVIYIGVKFESKRSNHPLHEALFKGDTGSIREIKNLRCISELHIAHFILLLFNLSRWECGKLNRIHLSRCTLDNSLLVNPLQYLVDIILILGPDKKISNIRF